MASYAENEDMITVGAYQKGSNPDVDAAIDSHKAIEAFLIQDEFEKAPVRETLKALGALAGMEIPDEELVAAEGAASGSVRASTGNSAK